MMKSSLFEDFIDNIKFYFDKYITNPIYNFKWFCKNVKLFWSDLWDFRPWDHTYCKYIYCTALDALKEDIYRNSFEIDETRMRKVEAMEELLMLLQTDIEDNFYQLIKIKKDGRYDFSKYSKAVNKGEKLRKERIIRLLCGQSDKDLKDLHNKYEERMQNLQKEHPDLCKTYHSVFNECEEVDDGTGVDCWWD